MVGRLDAIVGGGATLELRPRLRPWIGKEAALALLDTILAAPAPLIVLEVADRARAQR